MINVADACVDMLRVKPIDQQKHIDRCCELYNVRRDGGLEAGGEVEGEIWRRGCCTGRLRCAASEGRGDSLVGPRIPREEIRTCSDTKLHSSRQQGDEPPHQPLPQPVPQLKVWLSCRLESNKTKSTMTLSPYTQSGTHNHTCTHTHKLRSFLLCPQNDEASSTD